MADKYPVLSDTAGLEIGSTISDTRALLEATRVTTPDLTSDASWTVTEYVSGTGAISGGAFTVTMPTGSSSGSGSSANYATTFSSRWELTARVEITNDTDGEMLAGLSGVWSGGLLTVYVRGSGAWYLYQEGAWGFSSLTISGSSMPVDGTGWVRFRVDGTTVQVWTGIGSGSTPPTAWTLRAQNAWSTAVDKAQPTSLQIIGISNSAHSIPAGTTVVWRSVTLRDLSLGGA